MRSRFSKTTIGRTLVVACAILIAVPASRAQQAVGEQAPENQDTPQAAQLLSPDQLNNLVAPIALYPDPLLSQVLTASTYPLEIVEAQQWLGQNRNLQGTRLVEAAQQQNWDPSVQALVVFPNALALLAGDIRWTTDLGNAFLAQQADVMSAVQRMRVRAKANGRLNTTPQQVVTVANDDGQDAIEILPADPEVIYVPVYSPSYVWGAPSWGAYYDMWYPSGYGYGFGPGYRMSAYYSNWGSWGGWGGWGWGCGWPGFSVYVNTGFFNRYGYRGYRGYGGYGGYGRVSGFGGRYAWAHNPGHRLGVPYPNRGVASRFGSNRYNGGGRGDVRRSGGSGAWQRFGEGNRSAGSGPSSMRGFAGSGDRMGRGDTRSFRQSSPNASGDRGSRSFQSPGQSGRGNGGSRDYRSPVSPGRSSSPGFSAPRREGFSSPRSYSAPRQNDSGARAFASPRSFSNGGSARSFSRPSRGDSSPRSFASPRASGGGSGFSGGGRSHGNSDSSRGRSRDGGRHGR